MRAERKSADATANTQVPKQLGLALSGGGSRAAAFHAGTVTALSEPGLIDHLEVVSTVSGGSVFGGAWMAARTRGESDAEFVSSMKKELARGFVWRSIRPSGAKILVPGRAHTRTEAIASTFDPVFFGRLTLGDLPDRPALCINTTILNNGQVAKLSRDGLSTWGIKVPDAQPSHVVPLSDFLVSSAVAASAAFPIGLPPVFLPRSQLLLGAELTGSLASSDGLFLTDGGVLENLGVHAASEPPLCCLGMRE